MKSSMFHACIIAMLLVSTIALSEVLPYGDWETSGSESASASGSKDYEYNEDSNESGYYTTEEGYFSWDSETDASAWATVTVAPSSWACACAVGYANAGREGDYALSCASINVSETGEYNSNPPTDTAWGSNEHFDAYEGVYAEWVVIAGAQIEEGSNSTAGCGSYAFSTCSMP